MALLSLQLVRWTLPLLYAHPGSRTRAGRANASPLVRGASAAASGNLAAARPRGELHQPGGAGIAAGQHARVVPPPPGDDDRAVLVEDGQGERAAPDHPRVAREL